MDLMKILKCVPLCLAKSDNIDARKIFALVKTTYVTVETIAETILTKTKR